MACGCGYDDVGTKCTGTIQPGTANLVRYITQRFGGTSYGIYNCRTVRKTPNLVGAGLSFHAEGRALDHYFSSSVRKQEVIQWAINNCSTWGIQEIIDYSGNRRWTASRGWRFFDGGGNKHIHISQNWCGALNGYQPQPTPDPVPVPEPEDEDDMIIIEDPLKPIGFQKPGREPYFAIDVKGKKLLGFNGSAVAGDKDAAAFGFRYIDIPSTAEIQGGYLKRYDESGNLIKNPRTIVITAWDGGTFHFKIN